MQTFQHKYSQNHIAIPFKAHSSILVLYDSVLTCIYIPFSLCWNADVFDIFWTSTIHYMINSTLMNEFLRLISGRPRWLGVFRCLTKHQQRQTTRITTNKLIKQALTLQFGQPASQSVSFWMVHHTMVHHTMEYADSISKQEWVNEWVRISRFLRICLP